MLLSQESFKRPGPLLRWVARMHGAIFAKNKHARRCEVPKHATALEPCNREQAKFVTGGSHKGKHIKIHSLTSPGECPASP
jgi:hypothetical protein